MHRLGEIVDILKENNLLKEVISKEDSYRDVEILSVTFDSREVIPGTLFVCKGVYFKEEYLHQSVDKGAVCCLREETMPGVDSIPSIVVTDVQGAMPLIGDWFYDHPSGKIKIAGFTGTKGKTTCTHFMKEVLDAYERHRGGNPAGIISSNIMFDGKREEASVNTTPEAMVLQRELWKQVANGLEYCSMELSSQGLKYGRTHKVDLETIAFLNISRDHISPKEHLDFEDYYRSKLRAFGQAKKGIVDLDDEHGQETLAVAESSCPVVITYSLINENGDLYAYEINRTERGGQTFKVKVGNRLKEIIEGSEELGSDDFRKGDLDFEISMAGRFNVSNALAVIGSALLMGIPVSVIREGLKDAKVGGRMEVYKSKDERIVCIVDYAHNHLSFSALLDSVEEEYPDRKNNIISIFGADGGKAFERRKELGELAGTRTKKAYITADHPGPEPFDQISNEIGSFVEKVGGSYEIHENRGDAIRAAINAVEEPSVILIMGHGTQENQYYWGEYYPIISDPDNVRVWLGEYDRLCAKRINEK